jgi:hypothetical protein
MPKHATARQRSAWFHWQEEHAASVAATCRHFGIARSTFYRAHRRREDERLRRLLAGTLDTNRTRVRRGRPRVYWTDDNLARISWIDLKHREWGKRRVQIALAAGGLLVSEATVGRILRMVRRRCPVCRRPGGGHYELAHIVARNFARMRPPRS